MLAPIATLAFLVALWAAIKLVLDFAAEDGAKIASALAGRSPLSQPPVTLRAVSARYLPRAGSGRRPAVSLAPQRAAA